MRTVSGIIAVALLAAGCATSQPAGAWRQDTQGAFSYCVDTKVENCTSWGPEPKPNTSDRWWKLLGDAADLSVQGRDAVQGFKR